jgi:ABC-type branched-subunit amino acid transport system ATPase component
MKTIRLTDEAFEQIVRALEAQGEGKGALLEVLTGRYGPQSAQVEAETLAMENLKAAALEFHGISWRSGCRSALPVGSVFA